MLLEIVNHEAVVRMAYKDSVNVWTWGIGVTNSSGHKVYPRYKDNPQTLKRCLEVFEWLLRTRYAPTVWKVFGRTPLKEHHAAAALSFHWNTGGIEKARWPKLWMNGDVAGARSAFMNWNKPPEIIDRRRAERDLFFDGKWVGDAYAPEYTRLRSNYRPDWSSKRSVRVDAILADIIAERDNPDNPDMPDNQEEANVIIARMMETMKMIDPSIDRIVIHR